MQFFVTGTAPVLWSVAMSRMSGVQSAAGLAMINSIGLLGGFFGPNIFGIAEARTGDPAAAIMLLSVACSLALIAVFALRRLVGKNPVPASPAQVEA
jgi:nitrate/nitrite transporter NarK